jgi:serine/threonine protein kinase/tetratricopeptide (TPR) repeat protein
MPDKIGRYRVVRKLGEGGMGVVYEARDESLNRAVALKLIREDVSDAQAARRFRREARVAASVSHPNVCQLFEIDEENGALFIVMELLEGESLETRIRRGPVPLPEAAPIAFGILSALTALHDRDIVHRDLKPSNIFLTPYGVKLLDFGLARPISATQGDPQQTMTQLTQAGLLVGTPRYMAPEQVKGLAPDARTDLFAVGVVLFEMLTARPPFRGADVVEILYAIAHEQPPALTGSSAIEAVDRVVRRALAKRADDRYSAATVMASDLREALLLQSSQVAVPVRTLTRLIVLPFRCLRPDPETDFLAFSLPDAITATFSGLGSLVVRSSLAASKYAAEGADLKKVASEADVDAVLTGTLLRAGEQLRVSTQLVEAPAGTLIWSHSTQVTLTDILKVQDDLVRRIVESLSTPLTARDDKRLKGQLPASARAYEFYLRANQLSCDASSWGLARDLYERCIEEDSGYAPAWARLGRVYRLLAKYGGHGAEGNLPKAEAAFRRALEIDPDSPMAHNLFAQYEVESGKPVTQEVMLRLLARTRSWSHDAELFAALTQCLRYCGLLDASLAAERRARSLDPVVRTSVAYTYWMLGDYAAAKETAGDDVFIKMYVAVASEMASQAAATIEAVLPSLHPHSRDYALVYRDALCGRREEALGRVRLIMSTGFRDSEGIYFQARLAAYLDDAAEALGLLERVIDGGFFCFPAFVRDPWLDNLRADSRFRELLRRAEERCCSAERAFLELGGDRLLA